MKRTKVTKPEGLGDTIETVTKKTGIKSVVKKIAKAVGINDCGCNERREKLNNAFPYKSN